MSNLHHIVRDWCLPHSTGQKAFVTLCALRKDFDFRIRLCGKEVRVHIENCFLQPVVATSMINGRALTDEYAD